MEHCSKDLIKQLEKCLPEKLKYLPPFIFHLFESLIRLLYHDTIIIENNRKRYCRHFKASENDDKSNNFGANPSNFIAMNNCFLKQLKEECKQDGEIKTFEKDLEEAVKKPCEMK
ncbi:unnamed protein product [Acanthoscelides obtectus]|uniref:Uncharacterized protein n=1 Tax=Acanthoscelides obtectus TaxID=200917 RepID=A0A9P0JMZ9_ACAOB|nr:unnamed protein product [Acanthoscelides obtectus]CAK1625857.1 hypothetical protein AOBTE_LOCUS3447 [Acanthoscelides obtectus]